MKDFPKLIVDVPPNKAVLGWLPKWGLWAVVAKNDIGWFTTGPDYYWHQGEQQHPTHYVPFLAGNNYANLDQGASPMEKVNAD